MLREQGVHDRLNGVCFLWAIALFFLGQNQKRFIAFYEVTLALQQYE